MERQRLFEKEMVEPGNGANFLVMKTEKLTFGCSTGIFTSSL